MTKVLTLGERVGFVFEGFVCASCVSGFFAGFVCDGFEVPFGSSSGRIGASVPSAIRQDLAQLIDLFSGVSAVFLHSLLTFGNLSQKALNRVRLRFFLLDDGHQRIFLCRRIDVKNQTVSVLAGRLQRENLRIDIGLEINRDTNRFWPTRILEI